MPDLQLPEITLHYETEGAGPPLMLIPGMFSDNASWQPVVAPLSTRFRLILPDPRGAGRTTPPDAPITLEGLAADMLALADHLGLARFAVAGHSLGGLVALAMARQAPERLSALVALASDPRPSARIPAIFDTLCALRETAGEDLWLRALFPLLFQDGFFRDPAQLREAVAASQAYPHAQELTAMKAQSAALARLNLKAIADTLPMPALALLGEEDALIAPGPAGAAWAGRGAQVAVLPACAHSLHWDRPDAVAARIADFVDPGG